MTIIAKTYLLSVVRKLNFTMLIKCILKILKTIKRIVSCFIVYAYILQIFERLELNFQQGNIS